MSAARDSIHQGHTMMLSTRAGLAMVALALVSTTIVGFATYRSIETARIAQVQQRIVSHTGMLAETVQTYIRGAQSDVLASRRSLPVATMIQVIGDGDDHDRGSWLQQLAERFTAHLNANPGYYRVQLVSSQDEGRELLRVDRSGRDGAVRVVADDELRRQDDRGHLRELLRAPMGDIYLSTVDLARKNGVIETPHVPIMRVATPIARPDGKLFGVLVICVDMRPAFDRLRIAALPGGHIYVVNERDDYLVHPDRGREFASDFGRLDRLSDEFHALVSVARTGQAGNRQADLQTVADATGELFVLAQKSIPLADGRAITLVETLPDSIILEPVLAARSALINSALMACLAAVALAILFARSLTRPLLQITTAVQSFAANRPFSLPTAASGEIGILARAFQQMIAEITARTATIESCNERERNYLAAVDSTVLAVVTVQFDGTITAWSRGAERLFGYAADEAIGRSFLMIVPDEQRKEALAKLNNVCNGQAIDDWRTVRIGKTGKQVHVSISSAPLTDPSGHRIGASAILQDVTKQMLAEKKFRLAVESCPSGMIMVDRSGQMILVNGEIERLFGYDREELIGRPIELLVPTRLREQHVAHRMDFVDQPETRQMASGRNLLGRRKDGSELPVEVDLNPIHTEEGLLILSVIVDISERKLAQEMFERAVEACPSGMMTVDGDGRIVMANQEIERLFGYARGELISRPVEMLVPQQVRSRHQQLREDFTAWPETRAMGARRDLMALRKDGSEFPVEVGLTPIQIREDLMVLCVVQDISERKRAEQLKNEFVSTVSHELRTPLTSIAASLGLLAGNSAFTLPDPIKRLITIAQANSQRLVRLINDILDIEKIESGKIAFDIKRVEVRALAEQAIEASRGLAESHAVRLRLDEASVAADVKADADRLTQVVVNLLSNAIRFSPKTAEVVVSIAHEDGVVRISVRDHGPGIPEDFKARIFGRFAQAEVFDARQKGGTGLGLSIVRQIVARLDGNVSFADAAGGGTVFHVDLPDWASQSKAVPHEVAMDGARLLICDDFPALANLLAMKLAKVGFASDIALSGAEVISKATAVRYAAILIDLQLPDCDGISLIHELRAQPQNRDTPIIVISSDVNRGRDDLRSSSLHVLDWLQKPVDMDRLVDLLRRPGMHADSRRPHILHLDDDPEVLRIVAEAVSSAADVTSVATLDAARQAVASGQFDLAVIDTELSAGGGLELLPELRDRDGDAIPVIVFSGAATGPTCAAKVQEALDKNAGSIQGLVATLRKRIGRVGSSAPHKEDA